MTVENDGLPPTEGTDHQPVADGRLDPLTESLPLDAATATRLAAADAEARQAQLNAPGDPAPPATPPATPAAAASPAEVVVSEEPTQVLPLEHQQSAPPTLGTPMQGTMEGDLFDNTEPTSGGVS